MSAYWSEFDLGEFLGIGLDTNQIAYLAGTLFLGLLGLSALRHAKRAGRILPAIWISMAMALFVGSFLVAARGFPDQLPEFVRPWTDPDRLARAAAVLALLGCAGVLLSAHWVRGGLARFGHRLVGLGFVALAVWLAASWFREEIPDEVRPWASQDVLARGVVILGLLCLGGALWVRQTWGSTHSRWMNRALTPPAVALAVYLVGRWFITKVWPEYPAADVLRVTCVFATVATGTCLLIALGSYLLRDRPLSKLQRSAVVQPAQPTRPSPTLSATRPLPVAVMLDETGRPILPQVAKSPRAGPAGA